MKHLVYILLIPLLSHCSQEKSESDVNVVNGLMTSEFPAVVKISMAKNNSTFSCTGTFISHNILLTAAHCIHQATSVRWSGGSAIAWYQNSSYPLAKNWSAYDHALVKFADNSAPATMNISDTPIADGDEVTLVGFGLNDYAYKGPGGGGTPSMYSSSGVKRMGTNIYKKNSNLNSGTIIFAGTSNNAQGRIGSGANASLGQGDSGGPLIVEGKGIVGIASAQRLEDKNSRDARPIDTNHSYYPDLASSMSKDFFASAKEKGFEVSFGAAKIPKIETPPEKIPTEPNSIPPETDSLQTKKNPPISEKSDNFSLSLKVEEGLYSYFVFKQVPMGAKSITVYWNGKLFYSRSINELTQNADGSYTSDSSWGFADNTLDFKAVVTIGNGKKVEAKYPN